MSMLSSIYKESDKEINVYKIFYIVDMVLVLTSLGIVWLSPSHTKMAEYYAWGELGIIVLLIADVLIANEIFDTATIEIGNPKYFLLRWVHPVYIIIGMLFLGLIVGAYYWDRVLALNKNFIVVPYLFESAPATVSVDPKTFDMFATSYPVSGEEDTFWFGILLPTTIGIMWLGWMHFIGKGEGLEIIGLVLSSIIGIVLIAYTFSYVGHTFAYGGNQVAFEDAFNYGIYCGSTTTVSGNVLACRVAHTIHNLASVELRWRTPYQVYPSQYPSLH